jgi:Domain of unknown function (DUF4954)
LLAYAKRFNLHLSKEEIKKAGEKLLEENDKLVNELELLAEGIENSNRRVVLIKVLPCYHLFKELIEWYAATELIKLIETAAIKTGNTLLKHLPQAGKRSEWINVGGQLIPKPALEKFLLQIQTRKIRTWAAVHSFYKTQANLYPQQKLQHALAALQEVHGIDLKKNKTALKNLLQKSVTTKEWLVQGIFESRAKDYDNAFRKMVYENNNEMNAVTGKLKDNSFIKEQQDSLVSFKKTIQRIIRMMKL